MFTQSSCNQSLLIDSRHCSAPNLWHLSKLGQGHKLSFASDKQHSTRASRFCYDLGRHPAGISAPEYPYDSRLATGCPHCSMPLHLSKLPYHLSCAYNFQMHHFGLAATKLSKLGVQAQLRHWRGLASSSGFWAGSVNGSREHPHLPQSPSPSSDCIAAPVFC